MRSLAVERSQTPSFEGFGLAYLIQAPNLGSTPSLYQRVVQVVLANIVVLTRSASSCVPKCEMYWKSFTDICRN